MTLREQQSAFARLVGRFILRAYEMGYEVTLGDAFRDPRSHGAYGERGPYGRKLSNHKLRLAIDLNLFKDGKYLTTDEDHAPLGAYWESMDPHCRWGGHYGDGNHYEWITD